MGPKAKKQQPQKLNGINLLEEHLRFFP